VALPLLGIAAIPKCPLCVMLLFSWLGLPHTGHESAFTVLRIALLVTAVVLLLRWRKKPTACGCR
jgi:LPXTG-motif cell wall-anchored protein